MFRRVCLTLLGILVCLSEASASFAAAEAVAEKTTLKVGIANRPFYQFVDAEKQFSGLDVELGRAIFKEAGFNIEYIAYPWKRILHLIEIGELDVALSAADTEERMQYALFSHQTFRTGHNVAFVLAERFKEFTDIHGLSDLRGTGFKVAGRRGVAYSKEFDRYLSQPWFSNNLFVVDTPERLVDALLRGRADLFLGSEFEFTHLLVGRGLRAKVVPLFYLMSHEEAQTHIMYSKKSVFPEWVERVDQAIIRLKASGQYEQILRKYQLYP